MDANADIHPDLRDARAIVQLDACIPILSDGEPPDPMGLAAALVLFHVDGVASVREIAESAQMSVPDTVAALLELLAWGVVEVAGHERGAERTAPPESTVRGLSGPAGADDGHFASARASSA